MIKDFDYYHNKCKVAYEKGEMSKAYYYRKKAQELKWTMNYQLMFANAVVILGFQEL